ncbi:MAG TPA: hypothetical protein VNS09_04885 [Solirubrobacter sp.]|nr:hypothetical protein [Solirubrobacter sp.]
MLRFTDDHDPLLAPPAHVLAEVDAAWERAQELFAGELELHFTLLDGRVGGALRTLGGETVERLSPGEALAFACGDVALALAA